MANRIQSIEIQTTRFDPAEVELTVLVEPDSVEESLSLRGRLMGPRCLFNETIEIAYPLRSLPNQDDLLRARVIIPEPSLWEPATPFLYEGPVELSQGDALVDRVSVSHGVRQLALGRKGLQLNGSILKLRGVRCKRPKVGDTPTLERELRNLRQAGCNFLFAPATTDASGLWQLADRLGFLIVGQMDLDDETTLWHAEQQLAGHASCFGWLFPQSTLERRQAWHNAMSLLHGRRQKMPIGIKVEEAPLGVLPGHVSFLVCEERLLPGLTETTLPVMVLTKRAWGDHDAVEAASGRRILGVFHHAWPDLEREWNDPSS